MIRAVTPGRRYIFTPRFAGNHLDDNPTTIIISPLETADYSDYYDTLRELRGKGIAPEKSEGDTLAEKHIHGVNNYQDSDGSEVSDPALFWRMAQPDLKIELIRAIKEGQDLTPEEKKI